MARRRSRTKGRPWRPPALHGMTAAQLNRLSYLVVEERVEPLIGLLVSPWPRSGDNGQPAFPRGLGDEREVVVDGAALHRRLTRRRIPDSLEPGRGGRAARRDLQRREIAIGDVFAARLAGEGDPQEVVDEIGVGRWIEELIDITPEGRESAKAAAYVALTPPLSGPVVRQLRRKGREGS